MYDEEMDEDDDPTTWLAARAPDAATASANLSTPADLQMLLSAYQDQPTAYTAELRQAREASSAQQRELEDAIRAAYSQKSEGPSKSELYFKLAQSFLTPGKTGNFTEGLGNAAGVGAEYRAQQRAARQQDLNAQRAGGVELAKLRLGATKEEQNTLRGLDAESRKDRRAIQTKLLEQYLASGKPQSQAGKEAMDQGFKPGTPEFSQAVQASIERKLASGEMYRQAMLRVSQLNANIGAARLANEERKTDYNQSLLSSQEFDLLNEAEDQEAAAKTAVDALTKAKALNSKIFGGTIGEQAQYKMLAQTQPDNERVRATENFNNLMMTQAAAQLKSIFGGNPTEGERAILMELQGLSSKNPKTREDIIDRAIEAAKTKMARLATKKARISSGKMRMRTSEQPAETEE